MRRKIRLLAITISIPVLCACSTLPPADRLDIPKPPMTPPDTYLVLCADSLSTLPENRSVSQSEAWQTMVDWAADYHACKTKHAYLAGWVSGQLKQNTILAK